jgi:hypothetical protein
MQCHEAVGLPKPRFPGPEMTENAREERPMAAHRFALTTSAKGSQETGNSLPDQCASATTNSSLTTTSERRKLREKIENALESASRSNYELSFTGG